MEKEKANKEAEKTINIPFFNIFKKIFELMAAYLAASLLLNNSLKEFTSFEIIDVTSSIEKHADEDYKHYNLKIEPPINPAKVCVQPYIQITYKKQTQIIYLENLYTQKAYVGENGTFPLLKKSVDEKIFNTIKKGIEDKLKIKNKDMQRLSIDTDTIICFLFSENGNCEYYKFNATIPLKLSRYKALKILNPKIAPLKIDVNTVDQKIIETIVATITANIE